MHSFLAHRVTQTMTIHLMAPPTQVFPLLEPLGEKLWTPEWDPTILYPSHGHAELNAVFTTHTGDTPPAIWVIVQFDPMRFEVTYVRVVPESHTATISVRCAEGGAGMTDAEVTYCFTGLTGDGNAYVDTFSTAYYRAWIQHWEVAINHYLQHGTRIRHLAAALD